MNKNDFPENSDSSDEDYNPGGPTEVVSEVESDGDLEDSLSDPEDLGKRGSNLKRKTKNDLNNKASKRKVEGNLTKLKSLNSINADETENVTVQTEEEKKKHADSLWDMFKKDTGFKSAPNADNKAKTAASSTKTADKDKLGKETVKVTQIFEFAGEEVRVDKEIAAESAEARLISKTNTEFEGAINKTSAGLKGIGSVLNQLGKKQKLSTLEKTKLDWERFKKDENIEEELKAHTKGKDSYLDKQDFLERADLRRFEIEREVRAVERNKRLNNNPQ